MKLDLEAIKRLAKDVEEHNLSEVIVESNGVKITLKKEQGGTTQFVKDVEYEKSIPVEKINKVESKLEVEAMDNLKKIVSPMVGTYYSSPSPEADSFVKVGDMVEVGDTLCIVEAMKMMNEVKASEKGTVVEVNYKSGDSVKKGDVLFLIK